MSKYDKKTVFNYVMGNDIDNFDIDDLENDWQFMKEVFDYTNDKKTYDLCDDILKTNIDLIKYLINKFKYDEDFILEISSNFLSKSDNKLDKLEVQIILKELFGEDKIIEDFKFSNVEDTIIFYSGLRADYESVVKEMNDYKVKQDLQLGFCVFYEEYKDRQILIDFIAKNMILEIFYLINENLVDLILSLYKDKSQVDKTISTKFILDYITNYDKALANYLKVHIDLINDIKISVDRIFKNFEYYKKNKYKDVIEGIINYIEDYSKENKYLYDMFVRICLGKNLKNKDICGYIGNDLTFTIQKEDEFGFYEDEISLNDIPTDEYGFYDIDNIEYEKIQNDILYIRLREDVKRMLNNNEVYDRYIKPYKKNNSKCKVLKFEQKEEQ